MSKNPFDEFDAPEANPFDSFGAKPLVRGAAQAKPAEGFVDSVKQGFKRALPETKGLLYGAGAAVAGAVGADGLRDRALDAYTENQKANVAPLQGDSTFLGSLRGEEGQSLGEWAGDTIGNFGGQAVQSLAAAGAGALVGSAAPGAGTAAGAIGGLVGRAALKRGVGKKVGEMLVEKAATDAGRKSLARGAAAAGAAGALNVGQETGIAFTGRAEDAAAAGETLDQGDALRAIGFGIPAGALDTVAEGLNVGRLMRGASADPSLLRRVATGAAAGSITEAGTEAGQAVLERAGADRALTGEEAYTDYIENAAAGALGGGVIGAGGGITRQAPPPPPPPVIDPVTGQPTAGAPPPAAGAQPAPVDPNLPAPERWAASSPAERSAFLQAAGWTDRQGNLSSFGVTLAQTPFDGLPVGVRNKYDAPPAEPLADAAPAPAVAPVPPPPPSGPLGRAAAAATAVAPQEILPPETGDIPLGVQQNRLGQIAADAGLDAAAVAQADGTQAGDLAGLSDAGVLSYAESLVRPKPGSKEEKAAAEAAEQTRPPGETAGLSSSSEQAEATPGERTPQGSALDDAAHGAATSDENDYTPPTEAQKAAGNYKKGHHTIAGLGVSIENPAGSQRDPAWPPLANHYGYFKGTVAADSGGTKGKQGVDVFLTPRAEDTSLPVFVVDQQNDKGFDEHKVIMGAANAEEARDAYLSNYSADFKGLGPITEFTQDEFKAWVKDPTKTKVPAQQAKAPAAAEPVTAPPAEAADTVAAPSAPARTEAELDTALRARGKLVSDRVAAMKALSDGDELYGFHEQGGAPVALTVDTIDNFTPDQMLALPREQPAAQAQPAGADAPAAPERKTNGKPAAAGAPKEPAGDKPAAVEPVGGAQPAVPATADAQEPAGDGPAAPTGAPAGDAAVSKRAQIDADFAANREARTKLGLKKGDRVSFTSNGKVLTGEVLSLGDKDQAMVKVGVQGARGLADYSVGARNLTKAEDPGKSEPKFPRVVRKEDAVKAMRKALGWSQAMAEAGWNTLERGGLKEGTRLGSTVAAYIKKAAALNTQREAALARADEGAAAAEASEPLLALLERAKAKGLSKDSYSLMKGSPKLLASYADELRAFIKDQTKVVTLKAAADPNPASPAAKESDDEGQVSAGESPGQSTDEDAADQDAAEGSGQERVLTPDVPPALAGKKTAPLATPPVAPEAPPAKAPKANKTDARLREADLFRQLTGDETMIGKSAEDIAAELHSLTADAPLGNQAVDKLARAIVKELKGKAEKLAKDKHRDPKVLAAAIAEALGPSTHNPDAFAAGFAHMLSGKTKSTMTGEDLAAKIAGYEGARVWTKTSVGRAFYEGTPVAKLANTGADLRRWWEKQKADALAALGSHEILWDSMKRMTERAKLFNMTPAEGATPGVSRSLEHVRDQVTTFFEYLRSWAGSPENGFGKPNSWVSPGIHTQRYYKEKFSTDKTAKGFLEKLVGDAAEYTFWYETTTPKEDWVDAEPEFVNRGQPKRPPRFLIDQLGARRKLLEVATQYKEDLDALNTALAGAKTAQELFTAGTAFKTDNPDAFKRLFGNEGSNSSYSIDARRRNVFSHDKYSRGGNLIDGDTKPLDPNGNKAKALTAPRLDHITRDGLPDHRKGQNVTPDQFKKTLGFADVGFGSWVGSKQDQDHLNYSFDAFMDLANHWGIPANVVGLNGLHFTIGALGHGSKAAAHFTASQPHPDGTRVPVINVTNTKGDGTVAHEWTHALDLGGAQGDWGKVKQFLTDAFMKKKPTKEDADQVARRYLTTSANWTQGRKKLNLSQLESAKLALSKYQFYRAFGSTDYYKSAQQLDGGNISKPYWSNDKELLARASEAWFTDTLGGRNTYLVNPMWSGDGTITKAQGYRGTPYPTGPERQLFNQLFNALKAAIEIDRTGPKPAVSVSWAKFEAALPESLTAGEARRAELATTEGMTAFAEQIAAEQAAADAADEARAEAQAAAALSALAELQAPVADAIAPPLPSETMGPPSDDDLAALFDQAAAELREQTQEEPGALAPGEAVADIADPDQWTKADYEEIMAAWDASGSVGVATAAPFPGFPTIHELGALGETTHVGYGLFETKGEGAAPDVRTPGKRWRMNWMGGGAMRQTKSGKGYTLVTMVEGDRPFKFSQVEAMSHVGLLADSDPLITRLGSVVKALERSNGTADARDLIAKAIDQIRAGESAAIIAAGLDRASGLSRAQHGPLADVLDEIGEMLTEQRIKQNKAPAGEKSTKGVGTVEAAQAASAASMAKEAAKQGVKGLEESMKGLLSIFGSSPGRLNSFPSGFDEAAYQKAKPHFEAALTAFQAAGKSLKDLFAFLIQQFGEGIKAYAIRFAKDQNLGLSLGSTKAASASSVLGDWVHGRLNAREAITWRELFAQADAAFGGTQAEAKYTPKDAYDALEMGINRYIMANAAAFNPQQDATGAITAVSKLQALLDLVPVQSKRTPEMDEFQQFSTVPPFAFLANWVAGVTSQDTMLEPSAGIGGLAVFAHNAGAKLMLNELSSRRAAVLQDVFPTAAVTHENAEQLHNILDDDLVPSVVVMNPPFSASAGRMQGSRDSKVGAQHLDQALLRLADGGRLVAIVGKGMALDAPQFAAWWAATRKKYDVRAVVPVDGSGYAKYGTTFDNVLIVIDKAAPPAAERTIITTPVTAYPEIVRLLDGVRNDRPTPKIAPDDSQLERDAAEQARLDADDGAGTGAGTGLADPVGGGKSAAGSGVGGKGGGRGGRSGTTRPGGAVPESGPVGSGAAGNGNAQGGGAGAAAGNGGPDSGVTITAGAAETAELTESIFEPYRPQKLQVAGAMPHPGELVQSAAMASVQPPDPTYTPNLPKETITKGLLSIAQIEAVVYAGQAHAQVLEDGTRRGFFIGDGTGVGKGREIAGIIMDNVRQGRTKAVWVSEKPGLLTDAKRDYAGIGGDDAQLFGVPEANSPITQSNGILFTTYKTLTMGGPPKSATKPQSDAELKARFPAGARAVLTDGNTINIERFSSKKQLAYTRWGSAYPFSRIESIESLGGVAMKDWQTRPADSSKAAKKETQRRMTQLADWLGKDFDGVIAFDEAHNAGNAVPMNTGGRGDSEPSQQALAVVELQALLPKARIVYVSATGATNIANLAFATRLGLWGPGTAFAGVQNFIADMMAGGLASMELIARDMKQMGSYIARSLSFDGVTYSRLEQELDPYQRDVYNRVSDGWQTALRNFEKALEVTGAKSPGIKKANNPKAVSAAKSAFWGAQLRFYKQMLSAMQMPAVIAQMEKDIANGDALALQLVDTNEAQQNRAIAAKQAEGDENLDDLDLTPRDTMIEMVRNAFPVQQQEEYLTPEGKKASRPVMDSDGNPVENKEAVAMRDQLIEDLMLIKFPDTPLDMVINHFGPDMVAEVTGRTRRRVFKPNEEGKIVAQLENRTSAHTRADADAFQADKKRIIIFSDAGGTGYSFHADNKAKNQRKRKHYLIQPGWRADKVVQGFGRTHRTNQKQPPHYFLATTNIPAHKRFLSAVARRLDQLGSLTKGSRDTANQGLFSEKDNIEGIYAVQAIAQLIKDIRQGQVPGVKFQDLMFQMGWQDKIDGTTGSIPEADMPDTRQFLNRMLSLKIDLQEPLFDAFAQRMEEKIEIAIQRDELDTGIETIKAVNARIVSDDVIFTDPRTKAETRFIELDLTVANKFYDFPNIRYMGSAEWVVNVASGRVWLKVKSGTHTDAKTGQISDKYRMMGTGGPNVRYEKDFVARNGAVPFKAISEGEAQALWDTENADRPTEIQRTNYMITGALLPIWDRLKTDAKVRVARTQTTDGQRLLGRMVLAGDVAEIRKRFSISSAAAKMSPADVMAAILKNQKGELSNGWTIERALVSGDLRIELKTGSIYGPARTELTDMGVIQERIQWAERMFIPVGPAGVDVLTKLFKSKPLVDLIDPKATAAPDGSFSLSKGNSFVNRHFAKRERTDAEEFVRGITRTWGGNAPKVLLVDTPESLPDSARADPRYKQAEGYYDQTTRTVYLVMSTTSGDRKVLKRVLMHEAVGHYGIEAITGPALWTELTGTIAKMRASVQHRDFFADLDSRYRGQDPLSPEMVREAIAVMAEKGINNSVIDRVVAAIRRFLRGLGFTQEFSPAELRQLIVAAARHVAKGKPERPVRIAGGRRMPAFALAPQVNSPEFRAWFRRSKVVKLDNTPKVAYHGTAMDFWSFDKSKLTSNTGHMTAPLGFFFAESKAKAAHYAEKSSEGVPADERVIDVYLSIQKPKRLSVAEFMAIDDFEQAAKLKARLVAEGFDGIHIPELGQWVAFEPAQVKSASQNRGGFDPNNDDMRFSLGYPAPAGYTISVRRSRDGDGYMATARSTTLKDQTGGPLEVGHLHVPDEAIKSSHWRGGDTYVTDDHRRKGVATALYQAMEAKLGMPAKRGSIQAPDGIALWDGFQRKGSVGSDKSGPLFSLAAPAAPTPGTITLGADSQLSVKGKLAQWGLNRLTQFKPGLLALIPMNYLSDYAHKGMTAIPRYIDERYKMETMRNQLHQEYDATAQAWLSFTTATKTSGAGRDLSDLMHDATISGVDPTGDPRLYTDPIKRPQYDELKARYDALPDEGKALFNRVRDDYSRQDTKFQEVIEANLETAVAIRLVQAKRLYDNRIEKITEDGLRGQLREDALASATAAYDKAKATASNSTKVKLVKLRQMFESMRVEAPYFPLKRFGDFWVAVKNEDGELLSFSKFETPDEQAAFIKAQAGAGLNVYGGRASDAKTRGEAIDPRFVAAVDDILALHIPEGVDFAGGDMASAAEAALPDAIEAMRDEIYQRYLDSMPDLSIRKSFIHRKKVPGYHPDALRSYSSVMFHGSYQLARLAYGMKLSELLNIAEDQAKKHDPIEGIALSDEMRKRHQWVMTPVGTAAGQIATTAAFVYHLGANPAHLFLNATQTIMLGVPVLGSRFGFGRTAKALMAATADFAKGKGHIDRANLNDQERDAAKYFVQSGLWEKTQAHDLAGVGETGVEYSALRQRVMNKLGWFFHQSERFNREVTSIAAYRLAREQGKSHYDAMRQAANLTYQIHFDYSAANRPRFMQSEAAKVLLVFRNYNVNLLYRLFRDINDSFRAETAPARAEARRQLGAMMGMYSMMAGVAGVPFYGLAIMLAGMFEDEDEPFTAEEQFKQGMVDYLGEDAAKWVLGGVPGTALGLDLTQRIGMPNLWFRSPDRQLEGKDAFYFWMEQTFGAALAIPKNLFTGLSQMNQGHVERGVETMMPSAVRGPMRAVRYAAEGATNMDGDKLADVTPGGVLAQLLGYTPAEVAEQYDVNSALKNADAKLLARRKALINRYAAGRKQGDDADVRAAQEAINVFNVRNPGYRITGKTIARSMKGKARADRQNEGGIVLSKRLRSLQLEREAAGE